MVDGIQISVVIPVYNVENYIRKCLDSVLSQTEVTIEVICVNDSSPDNSREIISEYIEKYPFIGCIDRPNGGLSAARNSGMKVARGEFIVLLDSDDWLEPDVLKKIYAQAKNEMLDVLIGNVRWIYPDRTHIEKLNSAEVITQVQKGDDAIQTLMEAEIYVPMAYNLICRNEFLRNNQLEFKEGLIYEDELWTPQVLLKAQRVNAIGLFHYNYLQRENTITTTNGSKLKVESFYYVSGELIGMANRLFSKQLKEQLWLRACILYFRGKNMQQELNLNNRYEITGPQLLEAGLTRSGYEKCLGLLHFSLTKRRIMRILWKLKQKNHE